MKIGDSVSHYRIVELLGAGGMGVVYKAEDTRLKRAVALKFLPFSLLQDAEAKERLIHEAQAASALDHPNICTIHEIEETAEGELFLAMAYYEGETLKERIARGPIAIEEALDLMVQIARAVAAAHGAGIIHRDLKPANIIITPRGDAKLLDFGIAKLIGQTSLTRTGTTLGTVAYMPPEQLTGRGVDARSDVWALGVLMYQMLAGYLPFSAENDVAMLRAIATDTPAPLQAKRADLPPGLEAVVGRALEKEPAARFQSAGELLRAIETVRGGTDATRQTVAREIAPPRTLKTAAAGVAVVAILAIATGGWYAYRARQVRTAKQTLAQIPAMMKQEKYSDVYFLLRQLEPILSADAEFTKLRNESLIPTSVQTDPPGADVYVKPYANSAAPWDHVGQSPLTMGGPMSMFRWRITKAGYVPLEVGDAANGMEGPLRFVLSPEGSLPDGMVKVPTGTVVAADGTNVRLPEFLIDTFEVTNRAFKAFIVAGGYLRRELWTEPFIRSGRSLSWDEAVAEFRDATGRPGPSTWELGAYPDGQDEYPVRGISWFEAAAFAKYAGKSLPTVHHWRRAARVSIYSDILALSNFAGKGPARVGEHQGIGPFGTYDMAGNVKEWCANAVGSNRYILGGAWNEPAYMFRSADARSPFDRSSTNGLRLIKIPERTAVPEIAWEPIERFFRDYTPEKPVDNELFAVYRGLYAYDPGPLEPVTESVDDRSPDWRVERVTYAAAYDNERIPAYVFLPKHHAAAPFQTVIYYPHSAGTHLRDFEQFEMSYLGFIVKSGHALLLPMFKGYYERRLTAPSRGPNAARDLTIKQVKDVSRSIDYLLTRPDIDHDRLAYFGVSAGAAIGPIALGIEHRFKSAVFWSGGFPIAKRLSEVDPINYAPRVTTPVLMLNGRDDFTFPIEASQLPMLRFLGPADPDKKHVLYDGGHVFPFARVEKDTLDWLDKYLGVPK